MSKITKKIEQLEDLLHQIEEVQVINSDDPETWDATFASGWIYFWKERKKQLVHAI